MTRVPLVSIGQGEFRCDFHPEGLGMRPTSPDSLNLRFLVRESADVYHAKSAEHLTSHALNEFRRCPLLYRKREMGLVPERDTTAYVIGRAAHTLILEGRERYAREYAVGGPINPKTGQPFGSQTKAFAEWAAQQSKPVLSDTHAALVEQMAAAVAGHPLGRELLRHGVAGGGARPIRTVVSGLRPRRALRATGTRAACRQGGLCLVRLLAALGAESGSRSALG